ncbi:hypothetical protein [Alteraurantiacibacter aquimixticola]|uniref:hypothetical protein n=1 Tax=Alteraurantiacibacter aquimixticola TaxID=2489173 RepID=UPI001B7D865E|nr:hypothetical protein [Alteraurantiacibacter aquimixticola]
MSLTFDFYDERAREAAAEAKAATLENVRERALRSEKTWRGLANQAKKLQRERAKADAERAARREREAEEARQAEEARRLAEQQAPVPFTGSFSPPDY